MSKKSNRQKAIQLTGIIAPFVGVSIINKKGEDNVSDLLNTLEVKITEALNESNKELITRIKQLLTSLDYSKLSKFQLQVIEGLQKEVSNTTSNEH
jgi:transcriptional regulatory protein LevR